MTPPASASGILLIDKPGGLTSHDVVAQTRRAAHTRKVGHAGTLDPMATGLLVLGVGSATRLLTYVVGLDKEYEATIRLGESTTTDDAEGEVIATAPQALVDAVTAESIAAGLAAQTGDILQRPSSVSAIKVDGKRAYARVRQGETVVLDARPVTISSLDVLGSRSPQPGLLDIDVRVSCSSGTYIRAIARDLGDSLNVGGHLTALRRTRIGPFHVTDAHPLAGLDPSDALLAPATVAAALFPVSRLDAEQSAELRNGKKIATSAPAGTPVAALDETGGLIGLFENRNGQARVLVNFPEDRPEGQGDGA